jgi:WD40 repeat protein
MKLKTQLIGLILNYKYVVTVFCILIISIRLSAQNSDALQLVNTLGFSSIFNIAINQVDGRVAASGRDTLWIYDEVFDHQQEIRIDGVIDDVAWSQDGNYLAVAYNFGLQEQRILVIDADDFSSVNTLVSTDSWSEERLKIAFSPNNQKIAISTNSGAIVWDFSADTTLQLQATSGLSTIDLDWSPDGTKVVGVNLSGSVYVWNSTTAQSIGSFVAPTGLLAVDWSATNSYIVIGGFDSYLATIDTTNFQLIFAFTYPDSAVSDVLTLDGSLIVISQEGNVYVYNAANHNLERQANVGNQILVEFSIKGTNNQLVFLTASSSLYTYSIATLEELSAYVAHGQSITAFDWSNSGNLIATGSLDGLLKLWEFDETTAHPTVFLLN